MRNMILIGVGELGKLYGAAALRAGLRVTPVVRSTNVEDVWQATPEHTPILVAVGEADLEPVLEYLPAARKRDAILLQNELFPARWRRHGLEPTVMIPWLLRKRGQPELVARATPVYGQYTSLVAELHRALGLDVEPLHSEAELAQALVDKYTFILTVNALGLLGDFTLGEWAAREPERIEVLSREAAALGQALCEHPIDAEASVRATQQGLEGMAPMRARGRSASERVRRAVGQAAAFGLELPALRRVLET
jgi:hypothetical protein